MVERYPFFPMSQSIKKKTRHCKGKVLHGVKPGMPVMGVAPLMAMKSLTVVSLRSSEAMGSFELWYLVLTTAN